MMKDTIIKYWIEMYGVETRVLNQAARVLNQAVSRNIEKFSEDFMFTLTRDEIWRISQIVTSSRIKFSKPIMAKAARTTERQTRS
jgi:hypothetical protein